MMVPPVAVLAFSCSSNFTNSVNGKLELLIAPVDKAEQAPMVWPSRQIL